MESIVMFWIAESEWPAFHSLIYKNSIDSYLEWRQGAQIIMNGIPQAGCIIVKQPVTAAGFVAWCNSRNVTPTVSLLNTYAEALHAGAPS